MPLVLCFRGMHCVTRARESFRLQATQSLLECRDLFAGDLGKLAEVKKEGKFIMVARSSRSDLWRAATRMSLCQMICLFQSMSSWSGLVWCKMDWRRVAAYLVARFFKRLWALL